MKKAKTIRQVGQLAAQIRSHRRRYYLHSRVKKFGRLCRKQKTVFLAHDIVLLQLQRKHLNELIENYQYAIQTEL